jgi:SulP family sulfate permease
MSSVKNQPIHLGPNYNSMLFKNDLLAGLTLFVMLVPQSMAYAMLAGLPPVMGLYASTIPLVIYALLGSSRHLSIGPVAITSLLVFSGVSIYAEPGSSEYITYVIVLALMVGTIQVLFGLFKVGFIVKFIPHSVLNGYTSAAAIVIGVSQLKHLLGIELGNYLQIHLLLHELIRNLTEIHITTLLLGGTSIFGLILLRKINPKIPGALIIVSLSISSVVLFRLHERGLQIVGSVPQGFPPFALPSITIELIQMLLPMALTISLLGFMESLSIGKAIARKEKYKINPNKEMRALGFSNIIGSCFTSLPVNGSFSRTAVNYQSGGRTQVTSIVTSACVIMTLFLFTSFFYYLPNAVLAAIIMVAVYKLIDIKEMKHLFEVKQFEGWVWVATFLVTLFIGIQWGILFGAVFTLLILLRRSAQPDIVELGYVKEENTFRNVKRYPNANTFEGVLIIRIDSNWHFANISYLEEKIKNLLLNNQNVKWFVIDMSGVNDVDTISIDTMEELIEYYQSKHKITFLFANMKGSIRDTVNKVGWNRKYTEQRNHLSVDQLLKEKGIFYENKRNHQLVAGALDFEI